MRLLQFQTADLERRVAVVGDDGLHVLSDSTTTYHLALSAIREGKPLAAYAGERLSGEVANYDEVQERGRLLAPLDHPDPAHCFVTGTGLTHLGSADTRDAMHRMLDAGEGGLTDSMKMFRMGLEGGKPRDGEMGTQPEWFYKGDGSCVAAPGAPLEMPAFALDGGEEPEIAGLYVVGDDGTPCRLGFALGNEFSDHVMEQQNYLFLAHSKLRPCCFGPELLVDDLPDDIRGKSRILRGNEVIWEKEFLSGEANMSHSVRNLEHHHFKYAMFRRPGDVHVHFFGTATLSFADAVKARPGDVFEVEAAEFGRPLRNLLARRERGGAGVRVL